MLKEAKDLTALGVSQAVAEFVFDSKRNNKVLNSEGLEVGNRVVIKGISNELTESVIDGEVRKWIDVLTDGDRATVSISRLVGTEKMSYFDKTRNEAGKNDDNENYVDLLDGFDPSQRFKLPRREADAIEAVLSNVGKTLVCAGIARNCGKEKNRTYVIWKEA